VNRPRKVTVNGRKWCVYDYILMFYDRAGKFKQCVSADVLSHLERDGNRYGITLQECAGYLREMYGGGSSGWEGT